MRCFRDRACGGVYQPCTYPSCLVADRPIEEWTLLEKLAEIATTHVGSAIPRCLEHSNNWGAPLSAIAHEAFDEIQRLRDVEVHLTARVAVLEIGINEALTALSSKMTKHGQ